MKRIVRLLNSVKLAIILIIIITCASILGTLIPQMRTQAEYTARYGQLAAFFIRLQLTDLYHSSWFIGLLFLFALNIITCTLTRLTPKTKKAFQPKLEFDPESITSLKISEKFRKNWTKSRAIEFLIKELTSRHFRIKEKENDNRTFLLARKKILGLFGPDIVHLGILIILLGGIISGAGGFRDNLSLREGQVLSVPRADFKLRLDKFETELYPSRAVKDWKSTLTVLEGEKPILSKTVEVNHPLSYKGFVFYQHTCGWTWENTQLEIWVKKRNDPSFLRKLELRTGEKAKLEGENINIIVLHFVPDFVINSRNQVTTRSLEPNNPAARIEGWQDGEKIFSGWVFAKFPDFSRIHSEEETEFSFELKNFRGAEYSVIQVAKDPGANFIWVGCGFLMAGLALTFYWPTREVIFSLEEIKGKTEVIAGGIASKSKDAFFSEFKKIMNSLRRSK